MRRKSRRRQPEGLHVLAVRGALALLLACLLVAPIAVQAELKATELAYSWDKDADAFEWGHVTIPWNGSWIPLVHQIEFVELPRPVEEGGVASCPADPSQTTHYGGWVEYGLPYTDTVPIDAAGFRESRGWKVFNCDLNGDGTLDDLDLDPDVGLDQVDGLPLLGNLFEDHPELVLEDCDDPAHDRCSKLLDDAVLPPKAATAVHCESELVTKLFISLDLDCDGKIDQQVIDDGFAVPINCDPDTGECEYEPVPLCVYSELLTPVYEPEDPVWSFPLPIRITDVDGAKTLMLYPSPTAVELAAFSVGLEGGSVVVRWETATELDNVGFNVYRAEADGGERIQLNDRLIPSHDPGSTVGSRYQFVDRSAQAGMAYEYWLEDIGLGGAGTMNGPVGVQIPRARRLPCRSRPAPMPGQWE